MDNRDILQEKAYIEMILKSESKSDTENRRLAYHIHEALSAYLCLYLKKETGIDHISDKYEYISPIYQYMLYIEKYDPSFKKNHEALYQIRDIVCDWKMAVKEPCIQCKYEDIYNAYLILKPFIDNI